MPAPEAAYEPFRVTAAEPLGFTDRAERAELLRAAGGDPALIPAAKVLIDLASDSGAAETAPAALAPLAAAGGPGKVFLSNALSGAARAVAAAAGSEALDLPVPDALDPALDLPFKGDIDLRALEVKARELGPRAAMIVMTLTNEALGGQPVSLANLRAAREISRHHRIPLFLDAARLAENAWLVKRRELGHATRSAAEIARELLSYGDASSAGPLEDELDDRRLSWRIASIERFAECLRRAGVPLVEPAGGHAVTVDAGRLSRSARALAADIYLAGGVRSAAVAAPGREWVLLALPRRAYTESQLAHAAAVVAEAAS